jgi:hypothetical protein
MMKKRMDDDIENVGIMQGFLTGEDEGENEGDGEEGSEYEDQGMSMPEMERSPKSPEILMNNLRGDMRSIDARRDELADLVGYQAATETPEPVLAMLQPVLAQQGGLGGLPQSQPMAQGPQPPMMPPPGVGEPMGGPLPAGGIADMLGGMGAAPSMPPGAMPPVQMARGGIVQRFQAGSGESGVTPVEGQEPAPGAAPLMVYSPELVEAARRASADLLKRTPAAVPTLTAATASRLPEYQRLLGADKGMAEAQMLLELGQRAFGFAGNVDEGGRPLRGGFFSRLAGATKTLPTAIGRNIEAMDKIDRQIKLLAVQQGEKDIDQVVAQNTKLLDQKRALFSDVLKADARVQAEKMKGMGSTIFGKGDWEWNVVNMPGLVDRYAAGQTDDKETRLVESAITKFKTPRYETHFDPVTKAPYTKEMPVMLPGFVTAAEAARRKLNLPVSATPALAPAGSAVRPATPPAAAAEPAAPGAAATVPGGATADATPGAPAAPAGPGPLPRVSLWQDRFKVSGPVPAAIGFVSAIPGMGDPAAEITLARQQAQQQAERVIESLMKSTAGSVREQERLRPVIGIIPTATLDPDAYGTKLIALGTTIQDMIREYDNQGKDESGLKPEDRAFARRRAMDLRRQYDMLGLPPPVYTEAEFKRYPPGTEVLWMGRTPAKVK